MTYIRFPTETKNHELTFITNRFRDTVAVSLDQIEYESFFKRIVVALCYVFGLNNALDTITLLSYTDVHGLWMKLAVWMDTIDTEKSVGLSSIDEAFAAEITEEVLDSNTSDDNELLEFKAVCSRFKNHERCRPTGWDEYGPMDIVLSLEDFVVPGSTSSN